LLPATRTLAIRRRHRRAILTTPSARPSPSESRNLTTTTASPTTESRHGDVVRTGTRTARRASRDTGGAPPCSASARSGGGGPAKAGYDERVVLVVLFAIRVVVRGCGGRLGAAGCEDGGGVSGTLACPEAGRVVV